MGTFTETALLARDSAGRQIVSIHVKRTYALSPSGACARAEKAQPLLFVSREGDDPVPESDVVPVVGATDLIVLASAHARSGRTRRMTAGIAMGGARWEYAVSGDRRCTWRGGAIAFSDPEPFERIPLRYENAYGGVDQRVPDPPDMTIADALQPHPGTYPRNPVGRGYVVQASREAIEGLLLPNVELPAQRLTPQNLAAGTPEGWWRQPLPWSCDWFGPLWYPRLALHGALPGHFPDDDREVAEVIRGWIAPGQKERLQQRRIEDPVEPRAWNAASPALVLPFLRGDEAIELTGMTPSGRVVVQLPGEVPRMRVRFEGRVHELRPVPNRVLVSTEEMGVYVVWHGAWHTPRQLPDRLPEPEDGADWDMEGIDVAVDGHRVAPLS